MDIKNKLKPILLILFILIPGYVVTEENPPSATEAGAPCIDQNCAVGSTPFIALQETANDQLCKSMQKKPECKGIDKELLKGCLPPDSEELKNKASMCGLGLVKGVEDTLGTIGAWVSKIFQDEVKSSPEDPGLKAYLHAEFEDASQDSGAVMAALETAGAIAELLYDSMAEVYSCLNPIGITKKVCQFIASIPITGLAGATAASAPILAGGTVLTLITNPIAGLIAGSAIGFITAEKLGMGISDLQGSENFHQKALATSAIVALLATAGFFGLPALEPVVAKTFIPLSFAAMKAGALAGATVGSMAVHDENVTNRIEENIKQRVLEFKAQQENQQAQ